MICKFILFLPLHRRGFFSSVHGNIFITQCSHLSSSAYAPQRFHGVLSLAKRLTKQVYCELLKLHENGFPNWISNVTELSNLYQIDIFGPRHKFNQKCKRAVTEHHIKEWRTSLNDVKAHPILKTYNLIKTRYGIEPYLHKVKNFKYRTAIAKLRTSSHSLEVERGRYTKPKTPAHQRLCFMCKTVEDEFHFIMECECNSGLRHGLFDKMCNQYKNFVESNQ